MGVRAFDPSDQQTLLSNFHCGPSHFQTELVTYIRGQEVLDELQLGAQVFLLIDDSSGRVAAFGSVLPTSWKFEDGTPFDVILWSHLAVDLDYRRSQNERGIKYSKLLYQEMTRHSLNLQPQIVGLYVHKDNVDAKRSYEKAGFQRIEEDLIEGEYERMIIGKSSLPLPPRY